MEDPIHLEAGRRIRPWAVALWILVVLVLPRVIERVATQWSLGQWYAETEHVGMPPAQVVYEAVRFGKPVGVWTAVILLVALWPSLGPVRLYRLWPRRLPAGIAVGIGAGLAWALLLVAQGAVPLTEALAPAGKLAALPLTITTGLGIEMLYRGFLLTLLAQAGLRAMPQVLLSAGLFALSAALFNWDALFWGVGFGLTLSTLAVWRGSVWPPVAAHFAFEFALQPALILGKLELVLG